MASFGQAFASARKEGKKVFTWNGKSYNTKRADDPKETPKKAPIPSARPAAKKGKFSGVSSDDLDTKKTMPKTGRDRFGPAPKAAPKAGKSGATQGFGLGEAKNSAAFKKSNERARDYQQKLPGKIGKSLRGDY